MMSRKQSLPYDAEVEYLETTKETGEAWINTGIIPTSLDWEFILTFAPSDFENPYAIIFGNYDTKGLYRVIRSRTDINANYATTDNASGNRVVGVAEQLLHEKHVFELRNGEYRIDGEITPLSTSYSDYHLNSAQISILSRDGGSRQSYGKLFSFKAIKANISILDLVPVRKGTEGFMYDKVSGMLFSNGGSGKFLIGPDVGSKSYDAEVEYIESSGGTSGPVILTDYVPNKKDTYIEYDFLSLGARDKTLYAKFFGCDESGYVSNTRRYKLERYYNIDTSLWAYNGNNTVEHIVLSNVKLNTRYKLVMDGKNRTYSFNDIEGTLNKYIDSDNYANPNPMTIGSASIQQRIYSFKIIEEGKTIFDMIPVRKGGKGYLYNKADGKLYGNTSEDNDVDFIVGPDI